MAKNTRIKRIRKALLKGDIYISDHGKERMNDRGYNTVDVIKGVLSGHIIETQKGYDPKFKKRVFKFVIEGKDYSDNPIAMVISERLKGYCLVTVMPPMNENRFSECI